jgi:hypothetical protein
MRKITLLALLAIVTHYLSKNNNFQTVEPSTLRVTASMVALPKVTGNGERMTLTRQNFEDHIRQLYGEIGLDSLQLNYDVFRLGMVGYYGLENEGALNDTGLLSIIDFSLPSTEKRFYTIDLKNHKVKYHTYVAHGRNTGQNTATAFSNIPHSNQSSLGFYVTGETYVGSKGYSLRLDGKEKSFNDNIRSRAVVIHAADYATESWIKRYGRLGRSHGCPALPPGISKEVINTIKNKTAIFTYFPDETYLNASRYLNIENLFQKLDQAPIQLTVERPLSRA